MIGVMTGARGHGEAESPSLGCRQDLVLSRLLERGFLEWWGIQLESVVLNAVHPNDLECLLKIEIPRLHPDGSIQELCCVKYSSSIF